MLTSNLLVTRINEEKAKFAEQQLKAFAGSMAIYSAGDSLYMAAVDFANSAGIEIVIAGTPSKEDTKTMILAV